MIWKISYAFVFFLWTLSSVSGLTREVVTNMPCFSFQFRCDTGKCIRKNYRCDNDLDCGRSDSSDEQNCGKGKIIAISSFHLFVEKSNKRKDAIASSFHYVSLVCKI
ncbi:hypothetical protein AVEN_42355-1 [Araneus ventricosus]|uniref:Uncharacterized protein n=1 Tax=Araneus ventricosus TaxID=182803 RepID=A0A4Y2JPX1_ARAVE|nr:hypothetical protein AVEN_42355-1 [Araneus ventricosus]